MEKPEHSTSLSPELALHKIKSWCAYQERSQHETRQKLYSFKLYSEDVENIIVRLIEENFLNEERFAVALAGGKFRIKYWGRNKIKAELKKHKVSDYCINKALQGINENDYLTVMHKVLERKMRETKFTDKRKIFFSVLSYMASRGFESDLVSEQLSILLPLTTQA